MKRKVNFVRSINHVFWTFWRIATDEELPYTKTSHKVLKAQSCHLQIAKVTQIIVIFHPEDGDFVIEKYLKHFVLTFNVVVSEIS